MSKDYYLNFERVGELRRMAKLNIGEVSSLHSITVIVIMFACAVNFKILWDIYFFLPFHAGESSKNP